MTKFFTKIFRKTSCLLLNLLSVTWLSVITYFLSLCEFLSTKVPFNNLGKFLSIKNNANLNTLELIKRAGYPSETHVVLTEDGYFLTMHRIPGSKNSPTVLLQHGLMCSSDVWVLFGKTKSLAFTLADQGYDVWLGNSRGNIYSRAHISQSPSDSKFWNFSLDEMGMYDLPAMISYITNLTLEPLHTYIGHSMGTTIFYIMAIKRPEISKMVKIMISLAPAAFLGNTTSILLRIIASFADPFEAIRRFFGANKFNPQDCIGLQCMIRLVCNVDLFQKEMCNIIFLINGFDKEQFNYTRLPKFLAQFPSGTSIKTILHYIQAIKSGKFCAYDYGRKKNMQIYGTMVPPDYDLSRITTPIALFTADNDWIVTEKDLKTLRDSLTNIVDEYRIPFPKFNHLDFVWAIDVHTLVYKQVLEIMKKKDC